MTQRDSLRRSAWMSLLIVGLAAAASLAADPWPGETPPERVGMDAAKLAEIDDAVREAIASGQCPGAVVLVSRFGSVVWWRPYGKRLVGEQPEPMSRETVFDMASLTKVMATASSLMVLVDRGQVSLGAPVARYIPEFAGGGKAAVTVEQLLRHRGGLIADNPVDDYSAGRAQAFDKIWSLEPAYPPGSKFLYTDVGYIVLGELVARVSGQPLHVFAEANIFGPLGMDETTFRPGPALTARAAPTELRDGHWMRGEVHDPRAFLLGGVAGHAGLFSTARDTLRYARMILCLGQLDGVRVLSEQAVRAMTAPGDTPAGQARGLGWDIDTGYSSPRGELFPVGSFGHTGFTGTSLWIDPASQTAVVILSNRVHPSGKGNVIPLRRSVATIVARSIIDPPWPRRATIPSESSAQKKPNEKRRAAQRKAVSCGIDVLARDEFRLLHGRRVGLITNHTGLAADGTPTIDLLHQAKGVELVALFSPEHGIRGAVDAAVNDSTDDKTGLPVYSLYGKVRKPTAEQLRGIDTLVFDIQDIGARFYTYSATLGLTLEAAAEQQLRFVVLDRPNPIGGAAVEGPVLDAGREGFTGYHRLPVRHGLTAGELARLYNGERSIGADLTVVPVEGWRRDQHYDGTGRLWVDPSPNMRSLREAELYPGIGLLETTNLSVGRGTDTPFERIGAPWLDGKRLAEALAGEPLEGVAFVPVRFTPRSSKHADKLCGGIEIIVTDRDRFRPVRTGLAIALQLRRLYPDDWTVDPFLTLLANRTAFEAVKAGRPIAEIEAAYRDDLAAFERVREKYLLYGER
jgi:uncharacterized protein YbbC (DUF1343 family)/CubicO group peptidase (beta-lactamase class C family)